MLPNTQSYHLLSCKIYPSRETHHVVCVYCISGMCLFGVCDIMVYVYLCHGHTTTTTAMCVCVYVWRKGVPRAHVCVWGKGVPRAHVCVWCKGVPRAMCVCGVTFITCSCSC